jgi:hypothetical protein
MEAGMIPKESLRSAMAVALRQRRLVKTLEDRLLHETLANCGIARSVAPELRQLAFDIKELASQLVVLTAEPTDA